MPLDLSCRMMELVGVPVLFWHLLPGAALSITLTGMCIGLWVSNILIYCLRVMLLRFSSVQFSCLFMSDFLQPHGLQHTRLPYPSPNSGACSNSCSWSQWCHPTISSSVIPFSPCLQSFPASWSFLMSQFFTSGSQSIGVSASASVLPMNIQDWCPLGWTRWISLQSKGLSRVFSITTAQKH